MKNYIPDTFFFVEFFINSKPHLFGPYLQLEEAITILVDVAPAIAASTASGPKYKYESRILEKILISQSNGLEWKTINTPLKEEKSYIYKKG